MLQEQLDERKLQQHRKLELEQAEAANRQRDNSEHRQTEASVDRAGHETKNASTNEKMQHFNGNKYRILCTKLKYQPYLIEQENGSVAKSAQRALATTRTANRRRPL